MICEISWTLFYRHHKNASYEYHWLKQFEMNDKHQVQLYSFGMSTGITTLLGLFYTLDQGSTNNSPWLTTMSDDFWSFFYVRRTLIQRTIMLEKVERAFWESTISMNLCFQYFKVHYHFILWWNPPNEWNWIQSDRVKESIDEIRNHRQTGFFLTIGLVVIMILLPLLVNSFFVWIILSSSKVSTI